MKKFSFKTIIIPNGPLSNNSLTNYSTQVYRRVDWVFGIGYGDDYDKAREMIMKLIEEDKRILKEPAEPFFKTPKLSMSIFLISFNDLASGVKINS